MALIFLIDGTLSTDSIPRVISGPLDETAHLLTTGLLLGQLRTRLSQPFLAAALVASVLLDVDHLPRVFGLPLVRTRTRPATHSLTVVMGVACTVLLVSAHQRSVLRGIAAGCAAHLARDVATGSAPLAWPITRSSVGVPYAVYAAVLIALMRLLPHRTCDSGNRRGIGYQRWTLLVFAHALVPTQLR